MSFKNKGEIMKVFLAIGLIFASLSSLAVEGYKNYEFGISIDDLKQKKPCSLTGGSDQGNGVMMYACEDFEWGGSVTGADFYFAEKELLRIGIIVPVTSVEVLSGQLVSKYGKPTTMPTSRELAAVDSTPNTQTGIGFASDTVWLRIMNESMVQTAFLIYTSPKYEEVLRKNISNNISDDI